MTATARRNLLLAALAVLSLALFAALASPGSSRATSQDAHATALKKCKRGANARKCRCPRGYRLVKRHGRYRCKKRAAAPTQDNTGTGTTPGNDTGTNTGTTTDPGAGTGTETGAPPAQTNGAQVERDDANYLSGLVGSQFGPNQFESSSGYYEYTYSWCSNQGFSFKSDYVSSYGNAQAVYNGHFELEQGYRVISSPDGPGWAGILIMTETDGTKARIEVDYNDTLAYVNAGNSHFATGRFSRTAGGAGC